MLEAGRVKVSWSFFCFLFLSSSQSHMQFNRYPAGPGNFYVCLRGRICEVEIMSVEGTYYFNNKFVPKAPIASRYYQEHVQWLPSPSLSYIADRTGIWTRKSPIYLSRARQTGKAKPGIAFLNHPRTSAHRYFSSRPIAKPNEFTKGGK